MTLKEMRMSAGLTQEELAKRLGVALATINRWEQGQNIPHAKYIKSLAKELNASPTAVVKELYSRSGE